MSYKACLIATKKLRNLLKKLYSEGQYSDLTISCGGKEHRVHKAIVCPQLNFFAATCRDSAESYKQVVILPGDNPNAVEIMVYYLYYANYNAPRYTTPRGQIGQNNSTHILSPKSVINTTKNLLAEEPSTNPTLDGIAADFALPNLGPQTTSADLALHVLLYNLAEKYSIRGLKNLAIRKFKQTVTQHWDSNNLLEAAKKCIHFHGREPPRVEGCHYGYPARTPCIARQGKDTARFERVRYVSV
ncbi:hypothetical protein F4824DRAFT_155808 [Ustulina deusta]|nr:hypothetical protein F4824DRAFT_155808 [Ustulina deusta]